MAQGKEIAWRQAHCWYFERRAASEEAAGKWEDGRKRPAGRTWSDGRRLRPTERKAANGLELVGDQIPGQGGGLSSSLGAPEVHWHMIIEDWR